MSENSEKTAYLLERLEALSSKQNDFIDEINSLRKEIIALHKEQFVSKPEIPVVINEEIGIEKIEPSEIIKNEPSRKETIFIETKQIEKPKSNIEKYIGENLISKIGIIITVIGVAIGAKYAIDHQLISPLTRIVFGYVFGAAMLVVAVRLREKYENFSAVLVSGAMAIMYFITYAAYDFYELIPRIPSFAIMAVLTAFTTLAAISYNRQIIAHIGLVGAYAVPFLLSEGSGEFVILLSYTAIVNMGILFVSFKKYWKSLYYVSFSLTWLIYSSWYIFRYESEHLSTSFVFASLFFAIFYLTFLSYKLLRKGKYNAGDIILLLANSFIFYGFGYAMIDNIKNGEQFLGLFTLCNAIIHFVVATIIYRKKLFDKNLLFLIVGLVLVFITIAIPVQLDGNWVTLLWAGEAALLYWIGRTKGIPVYERLSFPLMIIAFFSILHDWNLMYGNHYFNTGFTPVFNIMFLTSAIFVAMFGFMIFLNMRKLRLPDAPKQAMFSKVISFSAVLVFFIVLYFAFYVEISAYWNGLFNNSEISIRDGDYYMNYDLWDFRKIWLFNYTLLFFALLSFVNQIVIRKKLLGYFNFVINIFVIILFLANGLYILSELRESYLYQEFSEYYSRGVFYIIIRYISLALFVGLLISTYRYVYTKLLNLDNLKIHFELFLHITIIWILSSELLHLMNIAGSSQSYKLGLSILWGSYSLFMIVLGIWKKKKYLRIGAFALLGTTLIKLFFYDISHLNTISKTIVFVSLGVLMLITSFLYNKYKQDID